MKATTTKPAAKKPATKKSAVKKTKPASKAQAAKSTAANTYATAEAAVEAAMANGRERTAVIQVGPGAFTLGSRRAALKHGYTVLGRAAALARG